MLKNLMISVVAIIFVCCGIGVYSAYIQFFLLTVGLFGASAFLSLIFFVVFVVNKKREKKAIPLLSVRLDHEDTTDNGAITNKVVGFRVVAENGYCIFDKIYLGITEEDEAIGLASNEISNPEIDSFSVRTEEIWAGQS